MALDIKSCMAHIYAMNAGQSTISGTLPDSQKKQRLDAALTEAVDGLSRERIKSLISNGNLLIDGIVFTDPSAKKLSGKPVMPTGRWSTPCCTIAKASCQALAV